jgi:hypothetical protein
VKAIIAKIQKGMSFPKIKLYFLIGETLICSMVPTSFSDTILSAVSIPPIKVTKKAKIPGTKDNL